MSSEAITRTDLKIVINSLLPIFYPVGSYYETSDSTFNPNTEWGGQWELEAGGYFHASSGTGYTLGTTGGSASVKLTDQQMAHGHTYTAGTLPNHVHGPQSSDWGKYVMRKSDVDIVRYTTSTSGGTTHAGGLHSAGSAVAGGTATGNPTSNPSVGGSVANLYGADSTRTAHENRPPFIVVNRWHRTA